MTSATEAGSRLQPQKRLTGQAAEDAGNVVDKRRWISFLTWAFVLAEMAGRDGFMPTAAQAGEEEPRQTPDTSEDAGAAAAQLPTIGVATDTESAAPVIYQQAAAMPGHAASEQPGGELAEPHATAVGDGEPLVAGGTGGGGTAGAAQPDAADSGGAEANAGGDFGGIAITSPTLGAFDADGKLLDLGLHLDLSDGVNGLLGGVGDALGALPVVGGVLDNVTDTVANAADGLINSLSPIVSLLGVSLGGGDADGHGFGLASSGQLQFGQGDAAVHELSTPTGVLTPYGISLSIGDTQISHGGSIGADIGGVLDGLALDHLATSLIGEASDASQLDSAILRSASDVLA